jgi:hypothetical protein
VHLIYVFYCIFSLSGKTSFLLCETTLLFKHITLYFQLCDPHGLSILTLFSFSSLLCKATNETYLDRIAAFGPRIPEDGIYGFLIEPSDRSGCSVVEPARSENWIALLERGGCSFIEKVRNMQSSGAIAVAVGDPDHVGWTTMFAPGEWYFFFFPSSSFTQWLVPFNSHLFFSIR